MMIFWWCVTIALILLTTIVFLLKVSLTYWKRNGVATFQPQLFFGNVQNVVLQKECIAVNIKSFYDEMKSRGEKYAGYYFLMRPIFVPIDLDIIKNMYICDFAHFTDHIGYTDEERDPLSAHMVAMKGDKWKILRRKLSPAFSPGKIKMMFETVRQSTQELILLIDKMALNQEPIDVKDICQRYTIDNIASCTFGIECNSLRDPDSEFVKQQNSIFGSSFKQTLYMLLILIFPEFFSIFKLRMFDKSLEDFFMNLVRETVEHREKNNVIRKDFMHLLLQIRNNVQISENEVGDFKHTLGDGQLSLSLQELAAQCFVFSMGGMETSATTASFCLFELALNHNLQENVRREINAVVEKHGSFTYEALMEMAFLEKCVYETLRKYPPFPVNTRVCTKSYKIPNSDVVIKKGMHVFIPIYGIQMDPEYFPNPERFDPERYADENKTSEHPCALAPFGIGPRMCIGFRFGVLQVKLGVAVLLQNYKLSVRPETKLPLKFHARHFIPNAASKILLAAEKL